MTAATDEGESHLSFGNSSSDGPLKERRKQEEETATATCYCGAVQLSFPTTSPGLLSTSICHCTDCRKISASMFSSLFSIANTHLSHVRGRDNLTAYGQSRTIASGKRMTNYFCSTCGTLMYRVGERFPDRSILRIGTVDDLSLHETTLRPKRELFVNDRVAWLRPVDGAVQMDPRHG